jgi:hypothetical protein
VTGQLRGYDVWLTERIDHKCRVILIFPQVFLNIVLDNAVEIKDNNTKARMGMCVSTMYLFSAAFFFLLLLQHLSTLRPPRPG